MNVVFLHGLNTFNDGKIHVGPFALSPMHQEWERELTKRGFDFHAVDKIGNASVAEQAQRAVAFIEEKNLKGDLHLLGHSMGGLTAKVLACHPTVQSRVKSVATIGTPHRGADVARLGMNLSKEQPWLHRFFLLFGYDADQKSQVFKHLTVEACTKLSEPDFPRKFSFVCELARHRLGLPLRMIHGRVHRQHDEKPAASDGFIFSASQEWGEVRGRYELDHFDELGCHLHVSRKRRYQARGEFLRLVEDYVASVKSGVKSPISR